MSQEVLEIEETFQPDVNNLFDMSLTLQNDVTSTNSYDSSISYPEKDTETSLPITNQNQFPIRNRLGPSEARRSQKWFNPKRNNNRGESNTPKRSWQSMGPPSRHKTYDDFEPRPKKYSVQNRIQQIRNTNSNNTTFEALEAKNIEAEDIRITKPNDIETVEDDDDLTIEVFNNSAFVDDGDNYCSKFKMVLDPMTQAKIRQMQLKMTEKQVVYPIPVKPTTTLVSMHERFSML